MPGRGLRTGLGVGVMLFNQKGEILLGWHETKEREGWGFPGGEVELGEDIFETARRELFEETGVKCSEFRLISVSWDRLKTGRWVTLGLLCKKYSGKPRVTEPDKISRWGWFSPDKPPKPLFPPARKIIANYKAGRLYNVKEAEKEQGQS